MKKIPTLFLRGWEARHVSTDGKLEDVQLVTYKVRPGCEWVLEGKGIPTRMWNGLCCLIQDGRLWKRRYFKMDEKMATLPKVFKYCSSGGGGNSIIWEPITDAPEDKWHREAWDRFHDEYEGLSDNEALHRAINSGGTYELCGREINGNPEGFVRHTLIRHGEGRWLHQWKSFDEVKEFLKRNVVKGIVWWHEDDSALPYHERRLVKVTRKDFR